MHSAHDHSKMYRVKKGVYSYNEGYKDYKVYHHHFNTFEEAEEYACRLHIEEHDYYECGCDYIIPCSECIPCEDCKDCNEEYECSNPILCESCKKIPYEKWRDCRLEIPHHELPGPDIIYDFSIKKVY